MFNDDELYDLWNLANDAVFAWRKRLQHAEGKIDLNVPGNDPRNTIAGHTVGECKRQLAKAKEWHNKLSEMF